MHIESLSLPIHHRITAVRKLLHTTIALSLVGLTCQATAAAERGVTYALDIPSQDLNSALQQLALASQHKLFYKSEIVAGKISRALKGEYTAEQALEILLNGTNLLHDITPSGVVVIRDEQPLSTRGAGSERTQRESAANTHATTVSWRVAQAETETSSSASTPSSQPLELSTLEEISVTASRVRTGFDAPTPVTIIAATDLQKSGASSLANALNDVPSFTATNTPATGPSASQHIAGNFLNLRNLGPARTLVLVDGRRHVPTTAAGLVDLNVIPSALIDHVEVVTGGASAAWGSDAVAGVVNVLSRDDLQGFETELRAGQSDEGDNQEYQASIAYGNGFADGRGHFSIAAEYFKNEGVLNQSDRDWGAQEWQLIANPDAPPGLLMASRVHSTRFTEGGLIVSGPLAGTQFGPGGTTSAFNYGSPRTPSAAVGGDGVNPGSFRSLTVPFDRQSVFGRATFDFTDEVQGYVETSFARAAGTNDIVQSFNPGNIAISIDNAFLPAAVRDQMATLGITSFNMGRLNTDMGFFRSDVESTTIRAVTGLKGQLGESWHWDGYYEYGRTRYDAQILHNRIQQRFALSVDSVIDPATGLPACRSTLTAPTNGCVPVNLFGFGSPQREAIDYFTGTQSVLTHLTENAAAISLQGDPFSTWAGPVSVATGAEFRKLQLDSDVDALSAADAFMIGNPKAIGGSENVKEAFVEAVVPLLAELPLVDSLSLNLAGRWTDYDTSGAVQTWKVGVTYALSDQLSLRATRSRDIRAPNLEELFTSSQLVFDTVIDPASGQQVFTPVIVAGNPQLEPEKADTVTAGVVYQPSWAQGLSAAIDFYDIDLKGAITTLETQDIVERCADGAASLCALIERNPAGDISTIHNIFLNLSQLKTRGVDAELSYRGLFPSLPGQLSLRLLATYVDELSTRDGVVSVDRAGDIGTAVGGVPHWRGTAGLTYSKGPLQYYLEGRYIGGGKYDHNLGPQDLAKNDFGSVMYVNTSLQYDLLNADSRRITLFGSVRNLLDKDPPIMPNAAFQPMATNPVLYDVIGRTFSLGVRLTY